MAKLQLFQKSPIHLWDFMFSLFPTLIFNELQILQILQMNFECALRCFDRLSNLSSGSAGNSAWIDTNFPPADAADFRRGFWNANFADNALRFLIKTQYFDFHWNMHKPYSLKLLPPINCLIMEVAGISLSGTGVK